MKNKLSYLLVFFIIFFFSNITITSIKISNYKVDNLHPRASDPDIVNYLDYKFSSFTAGAGDRVFWEYSTIPPTNITVMAMNKTEYVNPENFANKTYYLLLSGNFTNGSGWFYPPKNEIWYIVFYHNDSSVESTDLTYYVRVYYKFSNPISDLDDDNSDEASSDLSIDLLYLIFYLALIFAGVIVAIAYFNYRKRLSEIRQ